MDRGFNVGLIDPTLFTKRVGGDLFICQLYVDDIIFGSTNTLFNEEFCKLMTDRFEMSMLGELEFFVQRGFKVGLIDPTLFTKTFGGDLFICQLYVDDIIFGLLTSY